MEENEDIFDDWFFNSFKRYHKLQMFGMDKPVAAMELSSNSSICLACEKPGEIGFEVLNLELPNKLFQIKNEHDSINTSRDLKVKCGTLTENRLIDMKALFGKSKTILSEEGVGNVSIYEMDPHRSDQMIPLVSFESKINNGHLAVDHTTNSLIIWGKENTNCHIGCLFDIENNRQVISFRGRINDPTCRYIPYFVSKDELIVLNSDKGSFDLHDLTSGRHIENINLDVTDSGEKWFSNTMYTSYKETTTFNVTLISSYGTLVTYDLRNCKSPQIYQKELFSNTHNDVQISFDPLSSCKNSVSGFDGNVYVIEESPCNKKMVHIFNHEGHLFTEDGRYCKNKVTRSTLWLPMCGTNTLLSAANDGSIQGWQYIS